MGIRSRIVLLLGAAEAWTPPIRVQLSPSISLALLLVNQARVLLLLPESLLNLKSILHPDHLSGILTSILISRAKANKNRRMYPIQWLEASLAGLKEIWRKIKTRLELHYLIEQAQQDTISIVSLSIILVVAPRTKSGEMNWVTELKLCRTKRLPLSSLSLWSKVPWQIMSIVM